MPRTETAAPFSLLTPLQAAGSALRTTPTIGVLALLLLLIPLFPIVSGLQWVLRESGSAALESWIAGAPSGTVDALLTRPDADGVRKLVLAALVLILGVAALLAAGAAAVRASQVDVRRTILEWPVLLAGFAVQTFVAALMVCATLLLADAAGSVRFQLFDVVALLGILLTLAVMARVSLWPSIATTGRAGVLRAMGRSWLYTRGQNVRLLASGAVVTLTVIVPALLLGAIAVLGLTALERAETITWAPVVIDAIALVPLALAIPVGVIIWSAGVGAIHPVLEQVATARRRDRSELSQSAPAGA